MPYSMPCHVLTFELPTTLVTGANSFVAAPILSQLIDEGHNVVGSVRRSAAGDAIVANHPEWADKFSYVVVSDLTDSKKWDNAFKAQSIDYVVHVAAPLLDGPGNTDYDRDFLKPSVDGNIALLKSATAHAPDLKSIVVTGSINAISAGDDLATRRLTNDGWNAITKEQAREANNGFISYCSAKKEAELAIWDFVKEQKPSFTVTVLLPALIFGPPTQGITSTKQLNFSTGYFFSLFNGTYAGKEMPSTIFPSYIDIRDLANAHVKSLTAPGAKNKRFLIGGMPFSNTKAVEVLRKEFPDLTDKMPTGEDEAIVPQIDAEEGDRALGLTFRTFEETMVDMAKSILSLKQE